MDNVANTEKLSSCCCGSANLKELKPYGIVSVQCRDCHVSLRKQDWNRVMEPHNPLQHMLNNRLVPPGKAVISKSTLMTWYDTLQEALEHPQYDHTVRAKHVIQQMMTAARED